MINQTYYQKVKKYFNGDDKKTWDWFITIHPRLGMLSPLNAIKLGREKYVMQFIDKEMEELCR